MRIVAEVDEDELKSEKIKVKVGDMELCGDQERQLKELLGRYEDVVCMEVGKATGVSHSIKTGESQLIRSPPSYRLAPAWKDQLRKEI